MATLVDSNVLVDVASDDARWAAWSSTALARQAAAGPLLINDIVFAEVSARFADLVAAEAFIDDGGLEIAPMPHAALYLAARAHLTYRARGGQRTGVLPDFFIGAQAAVLDVPLLTRDARRYRGYFPTLRLIAPDQAA